MLFSFLLPPPERNCAGRDFNGKYLLVPGQGEFLFGEQLGQGILLAGSSSHQYLAVSGLGIPQDIVFPLFSQRVTDYLRDSDSPTVMLSNSRVFLNRPVLFCEGWEKHTVRI